MTADVQRPEPLTEKELAEWSEWIPAGDIPASVKKMLRRLIADLRALRKCAEWARWHIAEEWPNGPTGSLDDWERFLSIVGKPESGPPPTLT